MSKLIIAEKPSLARGLVGALSAEDTFRRKDGYFEGEEYLVSYAFGHLFRLIPLEDYLPAERKVRGWNMDVLPFFPGEGRPEDYRFELLGKRGSGKEKMDEGVKKQFGILKKLMNRADVDEIIHCGDADREGEVIIRLIIEKGLDKEKPVTRIWLPDQTEETILEQLHNRSSDAEYDDLYREGICRTLMDWMYGINLTRYVTLNTPDREVYSVGRVLSPIVKAVYDREMEIRAFRPVHYFVLESNEDFHGVPVKLARERKFWPDNLVDLGKLAMQLNGAEAKVTDVKRKEKIRKRPKLYSLSKLQGTLGKEFQMPMDKSLEVVQQLYEMGYVTYPRTNTEYLSEKEKEKVAEIVGSFLQNDKTLKLMFRDDKGIFDDRKIESHSALIPTGMLPGKLTLAQKHVFDTICRRFFAAFCEEECVVEETEATVLCGEVIFKVKGTSVKTPGWMYFEQPEKKDTPIPAFREGDMLPHHFEVKEKETKASARYTAESLSAYLKNPFARLETEDDEEEYAQLLKGVEIGTEATRTPIITKAISNGYISQRKGSFYLEPKGEKLIRYMEQLSVDLSEQTTVEMQMLLKAVYRRELELCEALKRTEEQIRRCFGNGKN